MDAQRIVRTPSQPVRRRPRVRQIGELRLPIAGPYRPRARLYLFPDGRLLWLVRLWESDHAVPHLVRTATLRAFARVNRLPAVLVEVESLDRRGRKEAGREPRPECRLP
ncbi:MAG: hypothetical protein ACREEC_08195 [Thermoplasmata archaeon]